MNDHIRAMNEKFNKRFRNNSNNYSYTQTYTQTPDTIYYNSTIPDSSRIVFDSGASWAVQLNEGYSIIHVNNISRNFCANHCK